jgi:hypothetical protein
MKLYVKATSSYKGDVLLFDVKKELKQKYKLDTRRQDTFIHLAVYGAQLLKEKVMIDENDELYITSGVGNIDVLQTTNRYVHKEKQFIKPFDFINMLGNTTSYYVASSLGMHGKNTFEVSDNFTFLNTLISVYASLYLSGKDVVLGSIDLAPVPDEVLKRILGVEKSFEVTSGVNYQKLSLSKENALAEIEFDTKVYSLQEIDTVISQTDKRIVVSPRVQILELRNDEAYFETMGSWYLNKAIEQSEDMIYIDCFDEHYKLLKVSIL